MMIRLPYDRLQAHQNIDRNIERYFFRSFGGRREDRVMLATRGCTDSHGIATWTF
jgi:hypothetical protein